MSGQSPELTPGSNLRSNFRISVRSKSKGYKNAGQIPCDPIAHKPPLGQALEELFLSLKDVKDRSLFRLPDLAEIHETALNEALSIVEGSPQELVSTVETLWYLFGKCVTVCSDGIPGNAILDYKETLPKDLTPLLVLDASVRVRTVYKLWKEERGGIVMLPTAVKRYDNHTIHVWNRGGGKGCVQIFSHFRFGWWRPARAQAPEGAA
ncbi:MAG: hypothetical protein WBX25_31865 [Rhodomicrobium sp.]